MKKIHIYHRGSFSRVQDSVRLKGIPDGASLVEGFLSKCEDVTSSNGYRYEPDFWGSVIKRDGFIERVQAREMLGCIEHPVDDEDYMYTAYDKAALIVLDVTMNGTDPFGVIGLLNNDSGTYLKSIVEFGSRIGVSTRGIGATMQVKDYTCVDPVGYSVITWDSVRNPNLPVSLVSISDSIKNSPRFKEMFDHIKLRDSGSSDFKRDLIDKDINKMRSEALDYIQSAHRVRNSIIRDGSTLIKAKGIYDKFISDGGSNEALLRSPEKHPLAYAYLRSL